MAANRSEASQIISKVAHEEGGTTQGSKSSQMQSNLARQRNYEDAAAEVGSKLANEPENVTKQDADHLHRAEHRALGVTEKGGIASQAQHQVAVNEKATGGQASAVAVNPSSQSEADRQANFEDAAATIGSKLVNEPGNVTKEDGDVMHSREQRAFGTTEKGGLASQVKHQAAENEKS
ncbi:MAG: hypothetical protein Q9190_001933 [Brigantiaea leucoxantha]